MILERSSQNLKKISKDGRTILEGVFAEFGIENRNGRVYEEREYLPHLEYLQKDIENGNLLGELDHPERFEVSLSGVSHRINELWYDPQKRQVLGRIEILDGTPKGQIAKSLLESGVPLSISSRAAGSVNEDKSVQIQQIYTYDLVAKPGFENAQLHQVNEGANADPKMARIAGLLEGFNQSSNKRKEHCINEELGVLNENISIIDVTDKFPSVELRDEAKSLIQKNERIMENKTFSNDAALNEWTQKLNGVIEDLSKRLDNVENAILESNGAVSDNGELKSIKQYVEKLRKIQESTINWTEDIAKSVNKIGNYADTLAEKSNKHYGLTKKIVETVDHNAKTLNATQDWVGHNAKLTNAIAETVDHNAFMLNGVNEWTTDIAKSVNKLNEWGEEKASAINDMHEWVSSQAKAVNKMHEWTSDIARNLNHTANYTEDMFGRAMSKDDAKKLIEYIELVAESKKNSQLKSKIDEMLTKHSLTAEELNEAGLKPMEVLTADKLDAKKWSVDGTKAKDSVDQFAKMGKDDRGVKKPGFKKSSQPKELKTMDDVKAFAKETGIRTVVGKDGKKMIVLDDTVSIGKGKEDVNGSELPKSDVKDQRMKLDQKPMGKLKEEENLDRTTSIKSRSSKLDERLNAIVAGLEKERALDEQVKTSYPFTQLLSAEDRKKFADLSESDKTKVSQKVAKNPTTESETIKKLWESALIEGKEEQPLWLELAPAEYKEAFEKANDQVKESIEARASFYDLKNQYQIDNFWQTSGIKPVKAVVLNENVVATSKNKKEDVEVDPVVEYVRQQMERYK